MRLWHKDLISVLPRRQLIGQWRECCAIAKNISTYGSPRHILVNRIMDYNLSHFYAYGRIVAEEMKKRGYKCDFEKFAHYFTAPHETKIVFDEYLFKDWHNVTYLTQCFYNLMEKHDCGGISDIEWHEVCIHISDLLDNKERKEKG